MDGVEAEIYEYDCYLFNSKLQVLLKSLVHKAEPETVFKILKITVVQQNTHEILNKINFQTNLTIDELAYYFSLTPSDIKYASKSRALRKHNTNVQWLRMQTNRKSYSYMRKLLKISYLYNEFDESNVIDLLNVERAFYGNTEISQIVYHNYFSKIIVDSCEFNLNEFLTKTNLSSISISDFEDVIRKYGEKIVRFVIDDYKNLIIIPYYVRENLNLILVVITLVCPNVTEILVDGTLYHKLQLPITSKFYSYPDVGTSVSLYFHVDEIERFLYQLYDKTDIMFTVKKVSNIRIRCDSKSVKKMLTLDLFSMPYKLTNFLADHFQQTYQTTDFLNYQFAFPWHCERNNSWKNITIGQKKYLYYFFNQTNIKSYFNLFDLFRIEQAFYDINLDFSYYPYLTLKNEIVRSQNGNEFNMYEIVKRFNVKTIQFVDFIKMLRIYGKFVERFIGSEYLIEIPEFQRNKLKKIFFQVSKYCKNCHTITVDGVQLRNLIKKFQMLKINDSTNKIFNYELMNTSNKSVSEIVNILNENEIFIEEINVRNYENFNEFLFLKILELPFLSKLTLSTYYRNFNDWNFFKHFKICKFSIQPNFLLTLHNNVDDDGLAGQFIMKFAQFLVNHNFHKFVKLQIFCYDCVFDSFRIFNDSLIREIGFGRMHFTSEHMIELSQCKLLDVIKFYDCHLLNDELLLKLAIDVEEWSRHVEIKVERCFITDVFFYRFAEHQIRKRGNYRWFYGYAFTKFEFINCHITIDWENSYFIQNETGDYIYIEESNENDSVVDVCNYEFYN